MKYCKICKTLYDEPQTHCEECRKKLYDLTDINEPVRLCVVGGTERAMLEGLLTDAHIPFVEQNFQPQGVANELVTGYDVKLNNINILVPFSAVPKASELLSTIETVKNPSEPYLERIGEEIERFKRGEIKEDKPMSPALRTTIKVISAIVFLILIGLVVFGTDKLMEIIKGLFGG